MSSVDEADRLYAIKKWAYNGSDPADPLAPTLIEIENLESRGLANLTSEQDTVKDDAGDIVLRSVTFLKFTPRGIYEANRQAHIHGIDLCTGERTDAM